MRSVQGKCVCALCGVDEVTRYPVQFGSRVFEVHHRVPLAKAVTPVRTTLADLAVLCANCHRAVHADVEVEANFASLYSHFQSRIRSE